MERARTHDTCCPPCTLPPAHRVVCPSPDPGALCVQTLCMLAFPADPQWSFAFTERKPSVVVGQARRPGWEVYNVYDELQVSLSVPLPSRVLSHQTGLVGLMAAWCRHGWGGTEKQGMVRARARGGVGTLMYSLLALPCVDVLWVSCAAIVCAFAAPGCVRHDVPRDRRRANAACVRHQSRVRSVLKLFVVGPHACTGHPRTGT